MAYILKIKYDGTLRRVAVQSRPGAGGPDLTYSKLELKIREIFQLPSTLQFSITYVDRDSDEVTLGEDQDIQYALVEEGLNPLRLDVVPRTKSDSNRSTQHNESKQKVDVDEDGFEGTDKHIQSSDSCDPKKLESDERTELEAKDVPLQFAPAASFINFSDSSNYERNPFSDQTSALSEGKLDQNVSLPVSTSKLATSAEVQMPYSSLIHDGIQCDMCGTCPIVGLRFKSNRQYDYDLCDNCYKNTLNKDEYFQVHAHHKRNIVSPLASSPQAGFQYSRGNTIPSNVPSKISKTSVQSTMATPAFLGNPVSRITIPNQSLKGKLDSRVVQDVTVPEGTPFPLGTRFIKTWRLKNSGKYPWPSGTKLVRVAGDNLASPEAVFAELFNVPPQGEIDVSLDLVAPTEPGLYAAHWRLMIPTGEKFGHRAWVLIEARAIGDSEQGINILHQVNHGASRIQV